MAKANYELKTEGALFETGRSLRDLNRLYPKPTLMEHYVSSMQFVDPNDVTGQVYPGFEIPLPPLPPQKN